VLAATRAVFRAEKGGARERGRKKSEGSPRGRWRRQKKKPLCRKGKTRLNAHRQGSVKSALSPKAIRGKRCSSTKRLGDGPRGETARTRLAQYSDRDNPRKPLGARRKIAFPLLRRGSGNRVGLSCGGTDRKKRNRLLLLSKAVRRKKTHATVHPKETGTLQATRNP